MITAAISYLMFSYFHQKMYQILWASHLLAAKPYTFVVAGTVCPFPCCFSLVYLLRHTPYSSLLGYSSLAEGKSLVLLTLVDADFPLDDSSLDISKPPYFVMVGLIGITAHLYLKLQCSEKLFFSISHLLISYVIS